MSDAAIGGGDASVSAPAPGNPQPQDTLMRNAVAFLTNPQVRASPLVRRVNFLKAKGLSAEQITEAFRLAKQPQTLEAIQDIISGKTGAVAPASPPTPPQPSSPVSQHSAIPAATSAPLAQSALPPAPPPPPLYPNHGNPYYGHPSYPPPKPPEPWTWKDYFIGGTLATAGVAAAAKTFFTFSPYELVRKEERPRTQTSAAPWESSMAQSTRDMRPLPTPAPVFPRADHSTVFAAPGPNAVAPLPAIDSRDEEIASLKGQLEAEQKQVSDLKTELDKVRREKVEMAVNIGKLKGQISSLQRAAERAEFTLETRVQERLAEQRRLLSDVPSEPAVVPTSLATAEPTSLPPSGATAPISTSSDDAVQGANEKVATE